MQAPVLARLAPSGDGMTLATGSTVLGAAALDGALWQVWTDADHPMTIVPLHDETGTEVVVVDETLNVVASIRPTGATLTPSALVFDAEDRVAAIVRGDGCGGIHAMTPDGEVVFFAGREAKSSALDVLFTDTGLGHPMSVLLAVLVALEVERLGPLHVERPASGSTGKA